MGNFSATYGALYSIKVISIDLENQKVLASWNGNPPTTYGVETIKKWKVNKPEPKKKVLGTDSY